MSVTTPVSLNQVWSDLGSPPGTKSLGSVYVRSRAGAASYGSGNIPLTALAGTVVGMPHTCHAWQYPANPDASNGYAWDMIVGPVYQGGAINQTYLKSTSGVNQSITHGVYRANDNDITSEARVVGKINENGTYRISVTMFGQNSQGASGPSYNSSDAPSVFAVQEASAGWLSGITNMVVYQEHYNIYGNAQQYTFDVNLTTSRPWITCIAYQHVYGPLHQPYPGATNQYVVYYSRFDNISIKKL
jgi:hypothetical protein